MATRKQIPVVAARMVEYQEGFENLTNDSAQWVIMNPKEAVALCAKAINDHVKSAIQAEIAILGPIVSEIVIPATTVRFIAKDKFVENISDAKVRISYLSPNFRKEFGDKMEETFTGSILCGRNLKQHSVDGPIINELGGKEKVETTLTEIYFMMECYANGVVSGLVDKGRANIFYVKNVNGILRAVFIDWVGAGWLVEMYPVEYQREQYAGRRVFSRNSLESLAA